jgi:hypothetical protein
MYDLLSKLKDYPRDSLSQILDPLCYDRKQSPDERSEQDDEKGGYSESNSIDWTCLIAVFSRCIHGMCVSWWVILYAMQYMVVNGSMYGLYGDARIWSGRNLSKRQV